MFNKIFKSRSFYSKFTKNFASKYDFDLAVIGGGPAGNSTKPY